MLSFRFASALPLAPEEAKVSALAPDLSRWAVVDAVGELTVFSFESSLSHPVVTPPPSLSVSPFPGHTFLDVSWLDEHTVAALSNTGAVCVCHLASHPSQGHSSAADHPLAFPPAKSVRWAVALPAEALVFAVRAGRRSGPLRPPTPDAEDGGARPHRAVGIKADASTQSLWVHVSTADVLVAASLHEDLTVPGALCLTVSAAVPADGPWDASAGCVAVVRPRHATVRVWAVSATTESPTAQGAILVGDIALRPAGGDAAQCLYPDAGSVMAVFVRPDAGIVVATWQDGSVASFALQAASVVATGETRTAPVAATPTIADPLAAALGDSGPTAQLPVPLAFTPYGGKSTGAAALRSVPARRGPPPIRSGAGWPLRLLRKSSQHHLLVGVNGALATVGQVAGDCVASVCGTDLSEGLPCGSTCVSVEASSVTPGGLVVLYSSEGFTVVVLSDGLTPLSFLQRLIASGQSRDAQVLCSLNGWDYGMVQGKLQAHALAQGPESLAEVLHKELQRDAEDGISFDAPTLPQQPQHSLRGLKVLLGLVEAAFDSCQEDGAAYGRLRGILEVSALFAGQVVAATTATAVQSLPLHSILSDGWPCHGDRPWALAVLHLFRCALAAVPITVVPLPCSFRETPRLQDNRVVSVAKTEDTSISQNSGAASVDDITGCVLDALGVSVVSASDVLLGALELSAAMCTSLVLQVASRWWLQRLFGGDRVDAVLQSAVGVLGPSGALRWASIVANSTLCAVVRNALHRPRTPRDKALQSLLELGTPQLDHDADFVCHLERSGALKGPFGAARVFSDREVYQGASLRLDRCEQVTPHPLRHLFEEPGDLEVISSSKSSCGRGAVFSLHMPMALAWVSGAENTTWDSWCWSVAFSVLIDLGVGEYALAGRIRNDVVLPLVQTSTPQRVASFFCSGLELGCRLSNPCGVLLVAAVLSECRDCISSEAVTRVLQCHVDELLSRSPSVVNSIFANTIPQYLLPTGHTNTVTKLLSDLRNGCCVVDALARHAVGEPPSSIPGVALRRLLLSAVNDGVGLWNLQPLGQACAFPNNEEYLQHHRALRLAPLSHAAEWNRVMAIAATIDSVVPSLSAEERQPVASTWLRCVADAFGCGTAAVTPHSLDGLSVAWAAVQSAPLVSRHASLIVRPLSVAVSEALSRSSPSVSSVDRFFEALADGPWGPMLQRWVPKPSGMEWAEKATYDVSDTPPRWITLLQESRPFAAVTAFREMALAVQGDDDMDDEPAETATLVVRAVLDDANDDLCAQRLLPGCVLFLQICGAADSVRSLLLDWETFRLGRGCGVPLPCTFSSLSDCTADTGCLAEFAANLHAELKGRPLVKPEDHCVLASWSSLRGVCIEGTQPSVVHFAATEWPASLHGAWIKRIPRRQLQAVSWMGTLGSAFVAHAGAGSLPWTSDAETVCVCFAAGTTVDVKALRGDDGGSLQSVVEACERGFQSRSLDKLPLLEDACVVLGQCGATSSSLTTFFAAIASTVRLDPTCPELVSDVSDIEGQVRELFARVLAQLSTNPHPIRSVVVLHNFLTSAPSLARWVGNDALVTKVSQFALLCADEGLVETMPLYRRCLEWIPRCLDCFITPCSFPDFVERLEHDTPDVASALARCHGTAPPLSEKDQESVGPAFLAKQFHDATDEWSLFSSDEERPAILNDLVDRFSTVVPSEDAPLCVAALAVAEIPVIEWSLRLASHVLDLLAVTDQAPALPLHHARRVCEACVSVSCNIFEVLFAAVSSTVPETRFVPQTPQRCQPRLPPEVQFRIGQQASSDVQFRQWIFHTFSVSTVERSRFQSVVASISSDTSADVSTIFRSDIKRQRFIKLAQGDTQNSVVPTALLDSLQRAHTVEEMLGLSVPIVRALTASSSSHFNNNWSDCLAQVFTAINTEVKEVPGVREQLNADVLSCALAEGIFVARYIPVVLDAAERACSNLKTEFPQCERKLLHGLQQFVAFNASIHFRCAPDFARLSAASFHVWRQGTVGFTTLLNALNRVCGDTAVSSASVLWPKVSSLVDLLQSRLELPDSKFGPPLFLGLTTLVTADAAMLLRVSAQSSNPIPDGGASLDVAPAFPCVDISALCSDFDTVVRFATQLGDLSTLRKLVFTFEDAPWVLARVVHSVPLKTFSALLVTDPSFVDCPLSSSPLRLALLEYAVLLDALGNPVIDRTVLCANFWQLSVLADASCMSARRILDPFLNEQLANTRKSFVLESDREQLRRQNRTLGEARAQLTSAAQFYAQVGMYDMAIQALSQIRLLMVDEGALFKRGQVPLLSLLGSNVGFEDKYSAAIAQKTLNAVVAVAASIGLVTSNAEIWVRAILEVSKKTETEACAFVLALRRRMVSVPSELVTALEKHMSSTSKLSLRQRISGILRELEVAL